MKVVHVITGLDVGGTELLLLRLLRHLNAESEVIALQPAGEVARAIEQLGISVTSLEIARIPSPRHLLRLHRALARAKPDVVQTWLYHADLLGGLTAPRGVPVIWNLRASRLDLGGIRRSTRLVMRACARLSRRLPSRIVCGSEAARRAHAAAGYDASKMVVIPNGFELDRFSPDPAARDDVRRDLALPRDALLVGLVARFDPLKDHRNFIMAAGEVARRAPGTQFLLCGKDVTRDNATLLSWIREANIEPFTHLLGLRDDVPRLTAALDVACLSSYSEGFPNAPGEAMASGVPCAVTDAGDAAELVGDTGSVVPPRDPHALAAAIVTLIEEGPAARSERGRRARERVVERYSIDAMVRQYDALYRAVIAGKARE